MGPVATRTDARRALLERLIDHAPLFPPASLRLEEALAVHGRARASAEAWLLGRFVCPASRLAELATHHEHGELAVSAVLDGDWGDTSALERVGARIRVEAIEAALPPDADPAELSAATGEVYLELPLDERLPERLDAAAAAGARAKVRCGGRVLPTVEELARFVKLCRERDIIFKATAGLHHRVRMPPQHGFVNLLAAAVFGREDEILADTDRAAFALSGDAFRWRELEASPQDVARARRDLFVSFGSCSFEEPVEELRALGVLPG